MGAEEYAYVAPDPLHPNIVYGGGCAAQRVSRFDRVTGEVEHVGAARATIRYVRTMPRAVFAK